MVKDKVIKESVSSVSGTMSDTGSYSGSETLSELSSYSNLNTKQVKSKKTKNAHLPIIGLLVIAMVTVAYFVYQRSNKSKQTLKKQAQDVLVNSIENAKADIDEATIVALVKQHSITKDEIVGLIKTLQPVQTTIVAQTKGVISEERYEPEPFLDEDPEESDEIVNPLNDSPIQIEEVIEKPKIEELLSTSVSKPPGSKKGRPKKIASIILTPEKEVTVADVEPVITPNID